MSGQSSWVSTARRPRGRRFAGRLQRLDSATPRLLLSTRGGRFRISSRPPPFPTRTGRRPAVKEASARVEEFVDETLEGVPTGCRDHYPDSSGSHRDRSSRRSRQRRRSAGRRLEGPRPIQRTARLGQPRVPPTRRLPGRRHPRPTRPRRAAARRSLVIATTKALRLATWLPFGSVWPRSSINFSCAGRS